MCARVDTQFGMVVNALKGKGGIYDDSAIFFFSDHGDFTGDYGLVEKTQNTFEDCLTRVPLIVKPPAKLPIEPGIRDQLVGAHRLHRDRLRMGGHRAGLRSFWTFADGAHRWRGR